MTTKITNVNDLYKSSPLQSTNNIVKMYLISG